MPTFTFTAPDGTEHSVEGPEGATREQAFHVLQLKLAGGHQAPAEPTDAPVTVGGLVKSADANIGKGLTGLLGAPGDLATLAHDVAPQGVIDQIKSIPGAKFLYNHIPGSAALKSTIPDEFSANYSQNNDRQDQNAAERYTGAVARALPQMATGMGPLAAIGSSVAGQGVKDVTGSDLAQAVTEGATGIGSGVVKAMRARQALQALKSAEDVKSGAQAVLNGPELASAMVKPDALKNVASAADTTLAKRQFDPDAIKEVRRIVDRWHDTNQPQTIADLNMSRQRLNEILDAAPSTQTAAARVVKGHLDDFINNLDASQIHGGTGTSGITIVNGKPVLTPGYGLNGLPGSVATQDAQRAAALLKQANADYRFGNSAEKIGHIIQNATDRAGTQASGMNAGNLQRQGLLPLLKDGAAKLKKMGFGSADEEDAVRTATTGTAGANIPRMASNMLGGGGGLGSVGIATLTGRMLGPGLGAALGIEESNRHGGNILTDALAGAMGAGAGLGLRHWANAKTASDIRAIENALLEKAPANAAIVRANRAAKVLNKQKLSQAVGRSAAQVAPMVLNRLYVGRNNGQ